MNRQDNSTTQAPGQVDKSEGLQQANEYGDILENYGDDHEFSENDQGLRDFSIPSSAPSGEAVVVDESSQFPRAVRAPQKTEAPKLQETVKRPAGAYSGAQVQAQAALSNSDKAGEPLGTKAVVDEEKEAPAQSLGRRAVWGLAKFFIVLFLSVVTVVFALLFGVTIYRTYFSVASEIEVPAIQGKDLQQANAILSKVGLRLHVDEGHYSNKFPDRVILSQVPAPGKKVKRDREVLAVVSLGPEQVTVPALSGKSLREVGMILNNNKLTLGKVRQVQTNGNKPDEVVAQKPAPGAMARVGTQINVDVNKGFGIATVAVPDWTGKSISNAKSLLDKVDLNTGRISWTFSDTVARGRIISQSPPAGSDVLAGSEVSFEVSAGQSGGYVFVQRHLIVYLPAGSDSHNVRIVLISGAAEETIYSASHVVGDKLDTWVSGPAESDIEIYVNNKLFGRDKL